MERRRPYGHDLDGELALSPFADEEHWHSPSQTLGFEAESPFVDELEFEAEEDPWTEPELEVEDELDAAEEDHELDAEHELGCRCREPRDAELDDEVNASSLSEVDDLRARIAAGERDENVLTNGAFFARHPELEGRKLQKSDTALVSEWLLIRDTLVRPNLGVQTGQAREQPKDAAVALTLERLRSIVPGSSPPMTLIALLETHRLVICRDMPLAMVAAQAYFESKLRFDAKASGGDDGKPLFYELGILQTPAGRYGECKDGKCTYPPPGKELPNPSSWAKWTKKLGLTDRPWTDPETQVRVGLSSLQEEAALVVRWFPELFENPGSDWHLRMAYSMPHSRGIGHTRSFLREHREKLRALPEADRWSWLSTQTAMHGGRRRRLQGENTDRKMALVAKLSAYELHSGKRKSAKAPVPVHAPDLPLRRTASAPVYVPSAPLPASATIVDRIKVLASPPLSPVLPGAVRVTPGMNLSLLAYKTPRRFRTFGGRRPKSVYGIIVHTTARKPAVLAERANDKQPNSTTAIDEALKIYSKDNGPHYVIGYDGRIYAVCAENNVAWHAGWGKQGYEAARAAKYRAWWKSRWQRDDATQLLPPESTDPNTRTIGIELLGDRWAKGFTRAQYEALAHLIHDIDTRYALGIGKPPYVRLLGHEDVSPWKRQNSGGGWDPGAHRDVPVFSWALVWNLLQQARAGTLPAFQGELDEELDFEYEESGDDPWTDAEFEDEFDEV